MQNIFKLLSEEKQTYWLPEYLVDSLKENSPNFILKYKGKDNFINHTYDENMNKKAIEFTDLFTKCGDEGYMLNRDFLLDCAGNKLKKILVSIF